MDVISGIASATQLVNYGHAVARRLIQLHKAAMDGPSFCRTQRFNIKFLLQSVQRICIDEASNIDSLLPLLIATANVATLLLRLLQPTGTFYNHWLWISKGPAIESSFRALNDKTRLLQLYITERTYNVVQHVRNDIIHMSQSLPVHVCIYPLSKALTILTAPCFHPVAYYLQHLNHVEYFQRLKNRFRRERLSLDFW